MQILIVGLGLIGGSMALALKDFEGCHRVGGARSRATAEKALAMGAVDRVSFQPADELPQSDLVILCQDPEGIIDFLCRNRERFKPGSLVIDVGGVKGAIMEAARCLPPEVDFIGCHPMAGKEVSGIDNAEAGLFRNTHFIITPSPRSTPEHLALLERLAAHCRFRDVVRTSAQHHDATIAYTSQLMHVIALSVCDSPDLFACQGYEGGSFRDCTRVAALDVNLWRQLFTLNAPALTQVVSQLEERLRAYREALERGDMEGLTAMLRHSSDRKRQLFIEASRGDDVHGPASL
jgi:prephenate dehydrogenase